MASYVSTIKGLRLSRSMGQTFLVSEDIARLEASLAEGRNVLELGPGLGILTRELCLSAKSVVAVELDGALYEYLMQELGFENLTLINRDFFTIEDGDIKGRDMLVSNAPYSLSSKVIAWVCAHQMEAVLCLQKEFVRHMLAHQDTRDYSRLSVMTALQLEVEHVRDVEAGSFYPKPKVDSSIIRIRPKREIGADLAELIGALMTHKKKTAKNAVLSSARQLNVSKERAKEISDMLDRGDERVFKLAPGAILEIAEAIKAYLETRT